MPLNLEDLKNLGNAQEQQAQGKKGQINAPKSPFDLELEKIKLERQKLLNATEQLKLEIQRQKLAQNKQQTNHQNDPKNAQKKPISTADKAYLIISLFGFLGVLSSVFLLVIVLLNG